MSRVHDLKCHVEAFEAQIARRKSYEFRRDDRGGFEVGDILRLREWLPGPERYTGRLCLVEVTYLTRGPDYGVPVGFACLATRYLA